MDGVRVSRPASPEMEYGVIYHTGHINKLDEIIKLLKWEVNHSLSNNNKGQLVGGLSICPVGDSCCQVIVSQAMVYPRAASPEPLR